MTSTSEDESKKEEANLKKDGNKSQQKEDEKKNFYIMFTIASILFSVLLAAINISHLILFYVYERQPFFPSGWNPWYNVIYVIAFYMLLYSFVYVKSYQSSQKIDDKAKNQKSKGEMTYIYIGISVFVCSYALHVYTGWFILDYQPPNYISD